MAGEVQMSVVEKVRSKRAEILDIAARYGGSQVRLFGSVASGHADEDSDIDFLVRLERGRSLTEHIAMIQELEDLLGRKVDVVVDDAIHRCLRDRVLREAIPL